MSSCGSWVGARGGSGLLSLCQSPAPGVRHSWQSQDQNSSKAACAGTPAAPFLSSCPCSAQPTLQGCHSCGWHRAAPSLLALPGEEQPHVFSRRTRGNVCCPLFPAPAAAPQPCRALLCPGGVSWPGRSPGGAGADQGSEPRPCSAIPGDGTCPGAQSCPHPSLSKLWAL